jgi:hypothetical protein
MSLKFIPPSRTLSVPAAASRLAAVTLPRIVLFDCSDEVVTSIRGAGHDVEVAYTGYFEEHPDPTCTEDLHEKDLLVFDLDPGWTPRPWEVVLPVEPTHDGAGPPKGDPARR